MMLKNKLLTTIMVSSALTASLLTSNVVIAGDAGAFLGGMVTSRVLHNMHDRTQAEQQQADYAQQSAQQQPAPQAAPAPAAQTQQQKSAQLDKLAAGGYVTPDEYKARKKAIIDGS
jgi:hypothetical protein